MSEFENFDGSLKPQLDNGTMSAQRANIDAMLDDLALEASIENAVIQRARNAGRLMLMPEDVAMRKALMRLATSRSLGDVRSEVARLSALDSAVEKFSQ